MVARLLLVAAFGLAVAARAEAAKRPGAAPPPMTLTLAPATVSGDGATPVELEVSGVEGAPPKDATVRLEVDGTPIAGRRSESNPGTWIFSYLPPRAAAPIDIPWRATSGARRGQGSLRVAPVPRAPAARVRSKGALAIEGPQYISLGVSTEAELSWADASPGRGPRPLDVEPPRAAVSVGRLEPPVRGDDGRWRARYVPPDSRFPQILLVVVSDASARDAVDLLAVPLLGQGTVAVRTKPSTLVRIRIGDEDFGPIRSDGSGLAHIPVAAPPGVVRGVTVAVDRVGNQTEAPLDLQVPTPPRLALVCTATSVVAAWVDARGQVAESTPPRIDVAEGALGPARKPGPGIVVRDLVTFVPGAEVSALLDSGDRSSCQLPPAPSRLSLTASRDRYRAGQADIVIEARLGPAGTRLGTDRELRWTTTAGTLGPVEDRGGGHFVRRWSPPPESEGLSEARIRASTGSGPLEAEVTIAIERRAVARLELEVPARRVWADGRSVQRVRIRALDAQGAPVAPVAISSAALGELTLASGERVVSYRAPRSRTYTATIDARTRDYPVVAQRTIRLQPERGAWELGARLGYLTNFGRLSGPLALIEATYHPAFLHRSFGFGIETGVSWSRSQEDLAVDGRWTMSVWSVPVLARIGYGLPLGRTTLMAAVGGGVLVPIMTTSGPDPRSSTSADLLGLASGLLGVDVDTGRGRVVLEAGYWYAPRSSGLVTGNFGGLHVEAGYRYAFW